MDRELSAHSFVLVQLLLQILRPSRPSLVVVLIDLRHLSIHLLAKVIQSLLPHAIHFSIRMHCSIWYVEGFTHSLLEGGFI